MAAALPLAALAAAAVAGLAALAGPPAAMTPPLPQQPVPRPAAESRQLVPVEVLRVIDGDTVEVKAAIWLDQWIVTRVRLRGIDAPERAARCPAEGARAEAARRRLAALLEAGPAFLSDLGRDKYGGRVLGRLIDAAGLDLGERLMAEGHARAYAGRRRETWC
jgi:endonuclease YncB( thermonuclease family)